MAKLDPMKAGGPHEMTVGSVTLKNGMVGEVWIRSGQSNMEWSVQRLANPQEEIAAANHPECTLYNREGLPASPFRTDR